MTAVRKDESAKPKKRGRQNRLDPQIKVTGEGRFRPPHQFAEFDIASEGSFVPIGSLVTTALDGVGAVVGDFEMAPGSTLDTTGGRFGKKQSRAPSSKKRKKKE